MCASTSLLCAYEDTRSSGLGLHVSFDRMSSKIYVDVTANLKAYRL